MQVLMGLFFPYDWLDEEPRMPCGTPVRTIGERLAYVRKTNARLLNPEWKPEFEQMFRFGYLLF